MSTVSFGLWDPNKPATYPRKRHWIGCLLTRLGCGVLMTYWYPKKSL